MMNVFTVEKKLKDFKSKAGKTMKQKNWETWKTVKGKEWLQNYKRRIERFVVDVDENPLDYNSVLSQEHKNPALRPLRDSECIGPARFIFRTYKSEKERVKESVEKNKCFETEPISTAVQAHKFRERDRSKEISSDMRFSTRLPSSVKSSINGSSRGFGVELDEDVKNNMKLHFKSAFSMLLKLGVLKSHIPHIGEGEDNVFQRYERLAEESLQNYRKKPVSGTVGKNMPKREGKSVVEKEQEEKKEEPQMTKEGGFKLAKKLLMKAMSFTGFCYLPKIARKTDPILTAAEKILVRTDFIKRTIRYDRRLGENKHKGYAPTVDLVKLSKKV